MHPRAGAAQGPADRPGAARPRPCLGGRPRGRLCRRGPQAARRGMKLSAETVMAGYAALFDPLTRAAHRACLEHAIVNQPDRWPTLRDCFALPKLYGVETASFAAFFGYIGWALGKRTLWVDAVRSAEQTYALPS